MAWIDNTSGTPVWHSPLQVPVTPYTSTTSLPGAPQSGNDNTIDTSDTRLLNVVYRNGSVWAVHTVSGRAGPRRKSPGTGSIPAPGRFRSQGRISDPTRWYYYPSIAVNKDDVAAIGFSGSSTDEYVGGYYTIVRPSSGIADPVTPLKAGEAPYYKTGQTLGIPGGVRRIDGAISARPWSTPSDDTSFWTLQEYARPDPRRTTGTIPMGNLVGKIPSLRCPRADRADRHAGHRTQVTLRWTDLATNETGYVVERRPGRRERSDSSPPPPPPTV